MRISDWSSDVCSSDLGALYARCGSIAVFFGDHGRSAGADRRRRARDHPVVPECECLAGRGPGGPKRGPGGVDRSEEHTSELQSLMRTSYAVFCLKKKHSKKTNLISLLTALLY